MKTTTIGIKILPSSNIDNGCSFYNSVLHMNSMNDYIDTNVVFDNEVTNSSSRVNLDSSYQGGG